MWNNDVSVTMTAMEKLIQQLKNAGFTIREIKSSLDYHKYEAYRKTALAVRECECNDGKGVTLGVNIYDSGVEVSIYGEFRGDWYRLQSYGVKFDDLIEKMPRIEKSLVAAWNALGDKND